MRSTPAAQHFLGWQRPPAFRAVNRRCLAPQASVQQGDVQTKTGVLQLKSALEKAVKVEDYAMAAKIRDQIKALESSDPVTQARRELEEAIRAERYEEAARLRDRLAELQPPPPPFECPPTTSDTVTNGVRVTVRSAYMPSKSYPQAAQHLFTYSIRIVNEGRATVQLMSRFWHITDGQHRTQDVRGPGVVGRQPVLAPGESYEYQSACPLATPVGSMEGHYQFVTLDDGSGSPGEAFRVQIGRFGLNRDVEL